jgi:2-succinyl-5-enolpyruvyl-6-hydroxy-3-cyclohexene-1-carboxylate synthase
MTSHPPSESAATDFAVALLDELVALGMRDIVIAPGSRSQALALAAAEFERAGLLRLRVRIDERVAGFLALGLSIESGLPVTVVCTSGTAVANLHPAVLEAHHSGVPLIVVSADRPPSMRGIGANQTTVQAGMFAGAVRFEADVLADEADAAELARTVWEQRGPSHLNIGFVEPLSAPFTLPADHRLGGLRGNRTLDSHANSRVGEVRVSARPGTVVVAGAGAGERAEEVARELGAPLLAEVASGAHFGPNLVVAYRELLGAANFGDRVTNVIVFGHPTLSREVPQLIQRDGVETLVVRGPAPDDYNPGHRVSAFADEIVVEGEPAERSWAGRWVAASRQLIGDEDAAPDIEADAGSHARGELAAVRAPVTRRALVEAVWRATWPHDRLVLGASRLIRELDRVAPGKRIEVHANRGLAGIDGTVSTGMGVALANPEAGTTRVLLGDLALLHDVGGLAIGVGEPRPRIQVIVGDDGGGTIFSGLEVGSTADPGAFGRVLRTEQQVSFEALAIAYGWEYRRAEKRGELDQVLTASNGPTLVEVPLPR